MKPIIIHSKAIEELDEAIAYYERKRTGLGLAFLSAIEKTVGKIQQNPQLGAIYRETEVRHYVVRRFPYIVFYAELEEVIWVAAIAHGKRRPGYWRGRAVE